MRNLRLGRLPGQKNDELLVDDPHIRGGRTKFLRFLDERERDRASREVLTGRLQPFIPFIRDNGAINPLLLSGQLEDPKDFIFTPSGDKRRLPWEIPENGQLFDFNASMQVSIDKQSQDVLGVFLRNPRTDILERIWFLQKRSSPRLDPQRRYENAPEEPVFITLKADIAHPDDRRMEDERLTGRVIGVPELRKTNIRFGTIITERGTRKKFEASDFDVERLKLQIKRRLNI